MLPTNYKPTKLSLFQHQKSGMAMKTPIINTQEGWSSTNLAATTLFGWFGSGSDTRQDAVLGTFDIKGKDSSTVAFDSLNDYIENKWAQLFVNGNIKLTTPVVLESLSSPAMDEDVAMAKGVRLLFKKIDTGYQSKEEEDKEKTNKNDNRKRNKEEDGPSQGGVEILVERLKGSGQLRVRARRCEIDEDTTIKEMSEETIVHELKTAIDVWKMDSA
ncbi:hypothetical protein IV203_021188 [Nitzschia inconspicua]|uniref:Uncharacterized protein n=1 Tax=Nitzschia inconspicua TaxID=303405 RepID=A0A9K3PD78_9STRA|nr:hypothetical protein IV203_021188 [Nitzschia inconspicua]